MTWKDWRALYMGNALASTRKGKALIPWNDKLWLHNWFDSRGIEVVPLIYSSKTSPRVKHILHNLTHYAVKPSHTSSSMFIWIVKEGKLATIPQSAKWAKVSEGAVPPRGSPADLEQIEASMSIAWETNTKHEDWPRNNVPPGVMVEALISDNTELKYSVVWGRAVGFLVDGNSEQFFKRVSVNTDGHSMRFYRNGTSELPEHRHISPPGWWHDGLLLAENIAKLALCDHARVDLYYHEGKPILNEFTWNPGGEAQDQRDGLVAKTINHGYEMRRHKIMTCHCESE
jgi:hypothetical protein